LAERLSIAFAASITHTYATGSRRHIKATLKHEATMEEIVEVIKVCVAEGVEACNLWVPILNEELEQFEATGGRTEHDAVVATGTSTGVQ
jgi:hypothetical protein